MNRLKIDSGGRPTRKIDLREFGYSRFSLRLWHGMAFDAWLRILWGNFLKISPARYPLILSVTILSLGNQFLKFLVWLFLSRKIAAVELSDDPIFIIGHWRSGTTWLNQILASDPNHVSPTARQCFQPETFLASQALFGALIDKTFPDKRPMDNVKLHAESAEEDEHSICLSGAPSPYRHLAFPCHDIAGGNPNTSTMSPRQKKLFWRKWRTFLKSILLQNPNKRLVLKSPTHTNRILDILSEFPNARFIHITRDPYKIIASGHKSRTAMSVTQALQSRVPSAETLNETQLEIFQAFHEHYHNHKSAIPQGHLVTIKYEDLVKNTKQVIKQIYTELGIKKFDAFEPFLDQIISERKDYKTNTFKPVDPNKPDEIYDFIRDYCDRYGYKKMADRTE